MFLKAMTLSKSLKVKSVLEYLEIVTDKAEDVANTIETLLLNTQNLFSLTLKIYREWIFPYY